MHNVHDWRMLVYLFLLGFITTLYKEWQRSKGGLGLGTLLWNALYLYAPLIGLAGLAAYADVYIVPLSILLLGVYIFLAVYDAKRREKETEQP